MIDPFLDSRRSILAGENTCEALAESYLARIERQNPSLNAFVHVDPAFTLAAARDVDRRIAEGEAPGLAGLMLGVKDVICQKGQPVQCASRMLEGFESLIDSTALARLVDAGAVVLGRTNCDEFAMGSSTENSVFGPARNPHDRTRVTGGSSGGSAAAVAADLCQVALGSDTGGSIRQPASFCGVAGLKPTYGRVSRFGLVAYASSFDSIGPFARGLGDLAAVFSHLAGHDPKDNTSADEPVADYSAAGGRLEGVRIGLPSEYFDPGLDGETARLVHESIARMKRAGASTHEISLPHTDYGIAAYYVLTTAEASSNLSRYDGVRYGHRAQGATDLQELYVRSRSEGFGPEVKRRIMLGTYALSSGYYDAYYGKAQRVRTLIRQDFDKAFDEVDIIATPAAPGPAFPLGSRMEDPLSMYLSDVYTVTANLAGIPGLVVPAGSSQEGLPIGIQLLGPAFSEAELIRAGRVAWTPSLSVIPS
ncbi:MAG: Asp-tRNA(Asn)/Glu-tRNA(Gln) amidotransferase subunit GatA [Rhodothermales bacterium]|nr:Asp-tRNA(Asn)/Glu-tRNA(Gln) amidotransferase subunit GatA [Rhodothermales bacterium]MBO6779641.1 Asp-tRNA(Asn)/Glu-tRNA(Gln) amidotransferase subunit GatA [Rhodothermales bacterium]